MRNIAKSLIFSLATSNIAYATPELSSSINYKPESKTSTFLKKFRKATTNVKFNYFAQYTGRSLSNNYQDGATYNRFGGGRSPEGKRRDATGSTELFQAISFGYKFKNNMVLSYGMTFQDNLTDNVQFEGDYGQTLTRSNGRSFNNNRINLWIPGIYSNKNVALTATVFYELPTTHFAKEAEMEYGYGIQPTLTIFSSTPGLFHGITASYERFVYSDYEFYTYRTGNVNPDGTPWINPDGSPMAPIQIRNPNPVKRRGMIGLLGGYLNYVLSDSFTLKTSIQFDYDQQGNQVGTLNEFGNNLDNIGNIGLGYNVAKGVNLQGGVTFAIEEPEIDKTAIFGSLNLSL